MKVLSTILKEYVKVVNREEFHYVTSPDLAVHNPKFKVFREARA